MSQSKSDIEESVTFNPQFEKRGGLLPVVVQESSTGDILMIASVNKEAVDHTIKSGKATFWSTSRKELWVKGETSGNTIWIDDILIDCDQDALVYKVRLEGDGVCHTKNELGKFRKSCFYRSLDLDNTKLTFLEK
ncbi:phosphoribosyl-AMP cyclohydrolase [Rhodohalobacter sp.]|uniref:phosphoribosyl-AMP cyclohydrolase n=1 Tax=Rhodohalobacter sp. TaxID=1974210 RepID=UPI002ACEA425|nr:phosphoribosyl-AMP cyclohydrolase [Rhodohalobacter sp.]MDZ7757861.1 phosphoribosyl-AMP cyclohydrolase [Rhodohalobacter sp.]